MEKTEIRSIAERWIEAWNGKDAELIRPFYDDNVVLFQAAVNKTLTGVENVLARYRDFSSMSDDAALTIRRLHVDGDTAILETNLAGTHNGPFLDHRPTGRHIDINICLIMDFMDGKIVKHTSYLDIATVLRAVGIIKIPETRPEAA